MKMLKELRKLGWVIPGRLHLLRHRFTQQGYGKIGIEPNYYPLDGLVSLQVVET
jgi:hypothetical protein